MTAPPDLPPRLRKVRLRTDEASAYLLAAHGLTVAPATLARWRSTKPDGPPYEKFGASCLYSRAGLDQWAAANIVTPALKGAQR